MGVVLFELQTKIKRQIEIIALCMSAKEAVKTFDLADYFQVEELTIKRDLKDLRGYGLDIHSHKKNGVCISNELDFNKTAECIIQYIRLNQPHIVSDRPTTLLIEKQGVQALKNVVLLQLCIDRNLKAIVNYNKDGNKPEKKLIQPILIYQNEDQWRLLIKDAEMIKQLLISKIEHVEITNEKFTGIDTKRFEDLFLFSWKSWLGEERYNIRLQFSPYWVSILKPKLLIHDQKLTLQKDGSAIFEATVNSLNEISSWIVSRGEGIIVLEPQELRDKVVQLAEGTLKNYN